MRKFTTLKEDLIKENAKVHERFEVHYKDVDSKLTQIKKGIDILKSEFYGDPTGLKGSNWGYVGSMEHISEQLSNILEFLNLNDENKEFISSSGTDRGELPGEY